MKHVISIATLAATMVAISAPALAGTDGIQVPEPVSLSLLAGGIAAIAAVKRFRRKWGSSDEKPADFDAACSRFAFVECTSIRGPGSSRARADVDVASGWWSPGDRCRETHAPQVILRRESMRNVFTTVALTLAALLASGAALAGGSLPVPEPVSLSLLAGGIASIAAVRYLRRK